MSEPVDSKEPTEEDVDKMKGMVKLEREKLFTEDGIKGGTAADQIESAWRNRYQRREEMIDW